MRREQYRLADEIRGRELSSRDYARRDQGTNKRSVVRACEYPVVLLS